MKAQLDIENSKTQKVETLNVPIISYEYEKEFVFDISNISDYEFRILKDAIDINLKYTDIEMFFVSMKPNIPNFGPDYEYKIKKGKLYGQYVRNKWIAKKIRINK